MPLRVGRRSYHCRWMCSSTLQFPSWPVGAVLTPGNQAVVRRWLPGCSLGKLLTGAPRAGLPRGHPITRRRNNTGGEADDATLHPGYEHLYLVDLDENTVRLPDAAEPELPGFAALVHSLAPLAAQLHRVRS